MNNMANMPMAGGPTPMMANTLAAQQVQGRGDNRTVLNTYIYDYFLREGMYDCARAMLKSEQTLNVIKESPGRRHDENGNVLGNGVGDDPMDTDSKDGIDAKRPSDLPPPNMPATGADSCFLYEWFCLFWDMLMAQRNKPGISPQVSQYVNHTQVGAPVVLLGPDGEADNSSNKTDNGRVNSSRQFLGGCARIFTAKIGS